MNGKTLSLNNNDFWDWLSNLDSDLNTTKYLELIRKNQIDPSYILELLNETQYEKRSTEIFDKLSVYMPRQYFLKVDFCAKAYATIFSQIFPPLMARVGELAYTEWLLYTEPENSRYRDHLIHMFKVAYVGDRLFSSIADFKQKIISCQFKCDHFNEWCCDKKINVSLLKEDDKNEIIELAYFFTALFHDFGYGYFFHCMYKKHLFKLYGGILATSNLTDISSQGVNMLLQSLACAFVKNNHAWLQTRNNSNTAHDALQDSVVLGFLHDCLPLNHSVASAFFIIDMAERLRMAKAINDKLYIAFHLAAEAAMIHDMTGQGRWAHLLSRKSAHFLDADCHNNVPLAMLLIFADELSAWNRYRLEAELEANKVTYSMDKYNVPKSIDLMVSKDKITVKPLHDQSHNLNEDPVASALKALSFLKKRKSNKHLNMMGYKIYVKPEYR